MSELQNFTCTACGREFLSTSEDVEFACGHLCIAADRGLTQREAIEEIRSRESVGGSREP